MLALGLIYPNDYTVREDGQRIGRIRYASERSSGLWLWHVNVTLPGSPFGDAPTLDAAKAAFKTAWFEFKDRVGPERLARAFETMKAATDRERR